MKKSVTMLRNIVIDSICEVFRKVQARCALCNGFLRLEKGQRYRWPGKIYIVDPDGWLEYCEELERERQSQAKIRKQLKMNVTIIRKGMPSIIKPEEFV